MKDLFADMRQENLRRVTPLAVRMRPKTLDEFVGQHHFLAPGKLLRRMLEADRLTSVLFYGPPGTGKTTLAQLIASYVHCNFQQVNAAAVGVKEVRAILDAAKEKLASGGPRTVLFIDRKSVFCGQFTPHQPKPDFSVCRPYGGRDFRCDSACNC